MPVWRRRPSPADAASAVARESVWDLRCRKPDPRSGVVCVDRGVSSPRRTCHGRGGSRPSPAGRMDIVGLPSGCDLGTTHRPGWRSEHAGANTPAHNTLSAESTHVQVFYPFHPLHGATLQVIRRPKRSDGAVSVIDAAGARLKIPVWMLSRDCADIRITEQPHLSKEALLSLASLLSSQVNAEDQAHDKLLQTAVAECEGGCRDAARVSGPADRKRKRSRATGRSGTRRSDRSDGPRSGGGVSRRRRKS